MKKKLICLIAVIAVAAMILTGCNIFVVDAERDYNQKIAEINYNGMTAYVTKGELSDLFNQYASYYIGQNIMTAEDLLDALATQLAKKELLVLKARQYFGEKLGISADSDLEKFLGYDEIRYARAKTNELFQTQLDAAVKNAISEDKLNKGEQDEEADDEDKKTPRPQNTHKWTDDDFEEDSSVTADDIGKLFPEIADGFTDEYEIDAWKEIQDNMGFHEFDYYYQNQLEDMLVQKFNRDTNRNITVSDAEIEDRYKSVLESNKDKIIDESTYKSAYEGTDFLFRHKYAGMFSVRSILLKFDEGQTALIETLKAEYGDNTDGYKAARKTLATDFGTKIYGQSCGIYVDISNPDFDDSRDESDDNKMYSEENVSFEDILERISLDVAKAEAAATTPEEKAQARIDAFDKWLYLVNDDPGMYDTENKNKLKTYTVSPKGVRLNSDTSSTETGYVEEYEDLARALAAGGRGNCYVSDGQVLADIGAYKADDVTYTDEAGQNKTAAGIAYTINDYGVQIIMINKIPVVEDGDGITKLQENGEVVAYVMGLDCIYDIEEGKTVREVLREKIAQEKGADNYATVEKAFFDEFEKSSIKRNKSVYNGLLKELEKALGL